MWTLVWSPIRYFERRLGSRPAWPEAVAAPLLCALLQGLAAAVLSARTRPLVETLLAGRGPERGAAYQVLVVGMVAAGYLVLCGLLVLAVLALNVFVRHPAPAGRLVECTALAFYTQVPCCLLMLALAWVWEPPALSSPAAGASTAELLRALGRHRETLLAGPLPATGRLLSIYSLLWLAGVIATGLRAASGLSARATVAVGALLGVVCAAGPLWAWLLEVGR